MSRELPSYLGSIAPRNGRGTSRLKLVSGRVEGDPIGVYCGLFNVVSRRHKAVNFTVTPRCRK